MRDPGSEVTELVVEGQMTDAMLRGVGALTHLTSLRVSGSQALTDAGITLLARLPNLRQLDLSGTAITDAGVAALAELHQLEHLSLAWTRVTDAGVRALARCDALQHVNLLGTDCGDGAIATFAGKPQLSVFKSGRATTDDALALFHEYPVFARWQDRDATLTLMSYDDGPNNLLLRGAITDRGVAKLAGLDGLFGLNLDDRALAITGAGLAPLFDLPHLGRLACDARDDAMPVIARMPHLRFLGCQDSEATDAGWAALGASRSIEKIWGRRCYGLANAGFLALSRIPTLDGLSVSCRNVDDTALAALPDFPALRELMPMDIPDAGYRHIARCTALESLMLMYCRDTTDAATEHLVALPALRKYFASYTQITDRTPRLLSRIASLEEVTFDSCAGLTNAGIAELATLPRLRELHVAGQQITSSVRAAFPARVTVHYTV